MFRKLVLLVSLLASVLILAGFQPVQAQHGVYVYSIHAKSAISTQANASADCAETWGFDYGQPGASIGSYDCLTGNSFAGYISALAFPAPGKAIVQASGNYADLAHIGLATYEIDAGAQSVKVSVVDAFTGQEVFDVRQDLSGPMLWGWIYVW